MPRVYSAPVFLGARLYTPISIMYHGTIAKSSRPIYLFKGIVEKVQKPSSDAGMHNYCAT